MDGPRQTDDAEYLTPDQVIDYLDHPSLRYEGLTCVLPAVRVDGEWRFRRSDLTAWLMKNRVAALRRNDS